jgi:antirestriction protein ArdC
MAVHTLNKRSAYDIVTDRILKALEDGVPVWRMSWTLNGDGQVRNAESNRGYTGFNVFQLNITAWLEGYADPRFITGNGVKRLGGRIKEGEYGKWTPVAFMKPVVYTKDLNGDLLDEPKETTMFRWYKVWNVEQCSELKLKELPKDVEERDKIKDAEALIDNMPQKPEIILLGDRACYIPSRDEVHMPLSTQFKTMEDFYATMFHELGHSTGHPDRLGRFAKNLTIPNFGSEDYSQEELVAEFTAAFLCNAVGVANVEVQSASYISSWSKRLNEDKKRIVQAASAAQKAANFIQGKSNAVQ